MPRTSITRLSIGWFIDRFRLNKTRLWAAAHLVIGVCGVCVAFATDADSVIALGAVLGQWFS